MRAAVLVAIATLFVSAIIIVASVCVLKRVLGFESPLIGILSIVLYPILATFIGFMLGVGFLPLIILFFGLALCAAVSMLYLVIEVIVRFIKQ